MTTKVIDFQAAKERIKAANPDDQEFSISSEIGWVEEQIDAADEELTEITNVMEELTQYIIELTNYMAGISVAMSIQDNGFDTWMDALKEQRSSMVGGRVTQEEIPTQLELELESEDDFIIDFIPDFELDDS
jgi:hypothetical protein